MAKSQKRSNRETRKPKADKKDKGTPIAPVKAGVVPGLEHMKR